MPVFAWVERCVSPPTVDCMPCRMAPLWQLSGDLTDALYSSAFERTVLPPSHPCHPSPCPVPSALPPFEGHSRFLAAQQRTFTPVSAPHRRINCCTVADSSARTPARRTHVLARASLTPTDAARARSCTLMHAHARSCTLMHPRHSHGIRSAVARRGSAVLRCTA